jgi:histone H3/H4
VPSWTSSIQRAKKNIDANVVSDRAKEKLREVLGELIDTTAEILMLIKEE